MTRNGVTEMIDTKDAGAVVDAGRRRIRLLLIAVLAALAVTATALVVIATPPHSTHQAAPVCLAFGPGPVNNGKAVIAAGVTMDIPEEGIVAALTAAMQETDLLNLANPNVPDSLVAANDGLAVDHAGGGDLAADRPLGVGRRPHVPRDGRGEVLHLDARRRRLGNDAGGRTRAHRAALGVSRFLRRRGAGRAPVLPRPHRRGHRGTVPVA